jgi:hypothetical protein
VPTFHTCLISRVYGLHVGLSLNGQPLGSSVTLKLPVQICSEGSMSVVERRRRSEFVEQAHLDADATFSPRNTGPPPEAFLGQSQLTGAPAAEPPSYTIFDSPSSLDGIRRSSVSVLG